LTSVLIQPASRASEKLIVLENRKKGEITIKKEKKYFIWIDVKVTVLRAKRHFRKN
jgi:hypothetical protein